MNKRIFTLAKKNFKEKFIAFFPNVNMPGLPKNHFLRVLVWLISYIFMGLISFFVSAALVVLLDHEMILTEDYFTYQAMLISLTIIIFSTYEILSDFFNAKDTEILLSLPLKNDEIFLGKLIGNVASDLDYFIFFAIFMVVYFVNISFDLVKLLVGIVSFVSLIVSAYCFLCLIILLVMRFTNVSKYKNLFKFIGYGILLLAFGFYYYFIFSANESSFDVDQVGQIMNNFSTIISALKKPFFPAALFGKAVGDVNLLAFLALLATGILSFLLVKFVASKIYLDSILEKDIGLSKKKNEVKKISKTKANSYKASGQLMAIAKKEFNSIIKNPVFLYQAVVLLVMMSAIIIASGGKLDIGSLVSQLDQDMLKNLLPLSLAVGLFIGSFIFTNNISAFTSLSREGKSFYLIQTLPIDPSSNLLGRFLGLYVIDIIISAILSLVVYFRLRLGISYIILFFLGMCVASVFSVFYGLYGGTKKIYTSWTKPAEINKTGFIGLLMYIVYLVIDFAIYGLAFGIYRLSSSLSLAIIEVVVGLVVFSLLFYLFGVERYRKGFFDVK